MTRHEVVRLPLAFSVHATERSVERQFSARQARLAREFGTRFYEPGSSRTRYVVFRRDVLAGNRFLNKERRSALRVPLKRLWDAVCRTDIIDDEMVALSELEGWLFVFEGDWELVTAFLLDPVGLRYWASIDRDAGSRVASKHLSLSNH